MQGITRMEDSRDPLREGMVPSCHFPGAGVQPFTFFISYRRDDTAPIALLLKSEIEKRLQFVRVFVDVDKLAPGEPFPNRLGALIGAAHATIVLIGKNWMPPAQAPDILTDEQDWVVAEIEKSRDLPLAYPETDRGIIEQRRIIPLFVDCEMKFRQFRMPESITFLSTLQAISIQYENWPTRIGPMLDQIAVELSLKKRPDADEYPRPDPGKARTHPMRDDELAQILEYDDFDGWYVDNYGNTEVRYLVKTFQFTDFNQAARFMSIVSEHCKVLDHHPEWRNVFNHVTVSLTTWDARRRITIYDVGLALFMNMAAKAAQKPA